MIWTQRHCSEQDGHDEQVIVVKHICKCETIASRVMGCLWISRVIVPLQLGYLHNQLSGLTIMCFPLFAAVFSLRLAPCLIEHLVYAQLMLVYTYLCYCSPWQGLIKSRYTIPYIFTNSLLLRVTGHCSLCLHCFLKETCLRIFFMYCCTEQ